MAWLSDKFRLNGNLELLHVPISARCQVFPPSNMAMMRELRISGVVDS
jgi:hypothetical protein